MKKIIGMILSVVLLVSVMGACQSSNSVSSKQSEKVSSEMTSSEEKKENHYPVTIHTYNSNKEPVDIVFEKAPEKVYVAYQNNIEIMLALGLGDKIEMCFGLDDEISPYLKDELAKVNYQFNGLPKEDVVSMQPDFILGWYSNFLDKNLGDTDYWNKNGTKTYLSLDSSCRPKGTPQTIDDEFEDILNIGKIFDVEDNAQALVDDIKNEISKIQEYIKGKDKPQIAVLEDETDSYRIYGANTLGGNVAIQAGADLKIGAEDSINISKEDLIVANPDVIFMVWYNGFLSPEEAVKSITENPAFASLDAVKNNKVFALNMTNIYCSGLKTKEGVLEFAKALYPELYK